jgi:predicted DNA-binding transcriptional regulator YafY
MDSLEYKIEYDVIDFQSVGPELGVSLRTLYRDIATLQAQGAEIEGEPGLGYVLRPGFMLPPTF